MTLNQLRTKLRQNGDLTRAEACQRFFKTGKGEYGEGDIFYGLTVPRQRSIAKLFYDLPLTDLLELLKSKIHEERFVALIIMVRQYEKRDAVTKKKIYEAYLKHSKWINNWDLVDTSTPQIVGDYCFRHGETKTLERLATSSLLWDRRIAILATFTFIRKGDVKPALKISKMLLDDKHDLIHKAVGWMLREVGKKDPKTLRDFLDEYATQMPRTALRYAIERFDGKERVRYLAKK